MNHEIRIPTKQSGFNGKYELFFFFFRGSGCDLLRWWLDKNKTYSPIWCFTGDESHGRK